MTMANYLQSKNYSVLYLMWASNASMVFLDQLFLYVLR